jgi:conjugal transfer pilus assembly protein TraV
MRTKMGKIALTVSLMALLLSIVSCGPKYACRNTMAGVKCETPTEVYQHVIEGSLKDQVAAERPPKADKNLPDKDVKVSMKKPEEPGIASQMEFKEERKPIRIQPRVVRLWLAPWEDSDGDLHMGGFIYVEVAGKKRWVLGEKTQDLDSRVTPKLMSPLLPKKEDIKERSDGKNVGNESDKAKSVRERPVRNTGKTNNPVAPSVDRAQ